MNRKVKTLNEIYFKYFASISTIKNANFQELNEIVQSTVKIVLKLLVTNGIMEW